MCFYKRTQKRVINDTEQIKIINNNDCYTSVIQTWTPSYGQSELISDLL